MQIGKIVGCNRLFSISSPFSLQVLFNTNSSNAHINWYCTDILTGSTCFTKNYNYINIGSTATVTIPKEQLFESMMYKFSVLIKDSITGSSDTQTCLMYAMAAGVSVIDINIISEANSNGYLDFRPQMNSFKALILNKDHIVNMDSLVYTWKITDASGVAYDNSADLEVYNNSIGIPTKIISKNNIYKIEVNVTDGTSVGYAFVSYDTDPDGISFELFVEPS